MIFAFLAVAMIGSGQLNILLEKKFDIRKIFRAAIFLEVILGLVFVIGELRFGFGLYPTIAILFGILGCAGITYPNAAAIALRPFSKNVGSAAALLGFLQLGIGAACSAGVGLLEAKGSFPTAVVTFISASFGLLVLKFSRSEPETVN